jgi:hypothetical protein
VSLASAAATGGSGTFTYQWNRSTQASFVPSAATQLAGQTALTLLDAGVSPNTVYYYALTITDTGVGGGTFNSATLGVCTGAAGNFNFSMPAVADFMDYFDRDFPYQSDFPNDPDTTKYFTQKDILKAFRQANTAVNFNLFLTPAAALDGFMLMSAHNLVENNQASSQGVQGQYNWQQSSKGGGGVSESFSIPETFQKNPTFAGWAKTQYGSKYFRMILPLLAGPMDSVRGRTQP